MSSQRFTVQRTGDRGTAAGAVGVAAQLIATAWPARIAGGMAGDGDVDELAAFRAADRPLLATATGPAGRGAA